MLRERLRLRTHEDRDTQEAETVSTVHTRAYTVSWTLRHPAQLSTALQLRLLAKRSGSTGFISFQILSPRSRGATPSNVVHQERPAVQRRDRIPSLTREYVCFPSLTPSFSPSTTLASRPLHRHISVPLYRSFRAADWSPRRSCILRDIPLVFFVGEVAELQFFRSSMSLSADGNLSWQQCGMGAEDRKVPSSGIGRAAGCDGGIGGGERVEEWGDEGGKYSCEDVLTRTAACPPRFSSANISSLSKSHKVCFHSNFHRHWRALLGIAQSGPEASALLWFFFIATCPLDPRTVSAYSNARFSGVDVKLVRTYIGSGCDFYGSDSTPPHSFSNHAWSPFLRPALTLPMAAFPHLSALNLDLF
ncbi:hypothetical protein B0H14DRAFT_3852289, partial [Mycena olivaceomarginata]